MASTFDDFLKEKDDQIAQMIGRMNAELTRRKEEKRAEAIEQIRALMKENGITADDVRKAAGRPKAAITAYKTGVKYQHPDNAAMVWAGKGKKPTWLRELEKKGGRAVEAK